MKCLRVCRLLPLFAGGDLPPGKFDRIQKHLDLCPSCQHEYRMYGLSLDKAKEWLSSERMDWRESDWMMSVSKASHLRKGSKMPLAPWPFKKGWALAVMSVTAALLTLFILRPSRVGPMKQRASALPVETVQPEIISIKMISEQTGLKINWFFRKDLKLEVTE